MIKKHNRLLEYVIQQNNIVLLSRAILPQTKWQTDRETDRQRERQTERQRDRQIDKLKLRWTITMEGGNYVQINVGNLNFLTSFFNLPARIKKEVVEHRRPVRPQWYQYKRLRYVYRKLLAPPAIPVTPCPDTNAELYRKYGHHNTKLLQAIQAHFICRMLMVRVFKGKGRGEGIERERERERERDRQTDRQREGGGGAKGRQIRIICLSIDSQKLFLAITDIMNSYSVCFRWQLTSSVSLGYHGVWAYYWRH